MTAHATNPKGCTYKTCPDFERHVRMRYELAKVKLLYHGTTEYRRKMIEARDQLVGDAVCRQREKCPQLELHGLDTTGETK